MPTYIQWDDTWTSLLASANVTDGTELETSEVSNDEKAVTEVAVEISYGATANSAVEVEIRREIDGAPAYETADSFATVVPIPAKASTTVPRVFTVRADSVSDFKLAIINESGADVTATIRYRQGVQETV